jgi:thiol-disulfide isomerase/thioredoxin
VLLLTTFATWCRPCNKEVPILNRLFKESAGRGLRVVAVSLDEKPPFAVRHWMKERKVGYPVYYADIPVREGRSLLRDVSMMPTTVLLSPRGNILRKWLGVVPEKALRAAIEPIIRKKKSE